MPARSLPARSLRSRSLPGGPLPAGPLPASPAGRRILQRTSLPAALAEELRRRILTGELAEGSQLRQETIAAEYGVSRIPVREALRQLEAEGLVLFHLHRGAEVTQLSPADIDEVFDLRLLIEVDLLKRAIPRLTASDLAEATRYADRFDEVVAAGGGELSRLGELNWKIHATLYAPAGRPRSMQLLQTLHYQTERYLRLQVLLTRGEQRASRDHHRMIELAAAGRTAEAGELLHRHIRDAGRSLVGFLAAQRPAAAAPREARRKRR